MKKLLSILLIFFVVSLSSCSSESKAETILNELSEAQRYVVDYKTYYDLECDGENIKSVEIQHTSDNNSVSSYYQLTGFIENEVIEIYNQSNQDFVYVDKDYNVLFELDDFVFNGLHFSIYFFNVYDTVIESSIEGDLRVTEYDLEINEEIKFNPGFDFTINNDSIHTVVTEDLFVPANTDEAQRYVSSMVVDLGSIAVYIDSEKEYLTYDSCEYIYKQDDFNQGIVINLPQDVVTDDSVIITKFLLSEDLLFLEEYYRDEFPYDMINIDSYNPIYKDYEGDVDYQIFPVQNGESYFIYTPFELSATLLDYDLNEIMILESGYSEAITLDEGVYIIRVEYDTELTIGYQSNIQVSVGGE